MSAECSDTSLGPADVAAGGAHLPVAGAKQAERVQQAVLGVAVVVFRRGGCGAARARVSEAPVGRAAVWCFWRNPAGAQQLPPPPAAAAPRRQDAPARPLQSRRRQGGEAPRHGKRAGLQPQAAGPDMRRSGAAAAQALRRADAAARKPCAPQKAGAVAAGALRTWQAGNAFRQHVQVFAGLARPQALQLPKLWVQLLRHGCTLLERAGCSAAGRKERARSRTPSALAATARRATPARRHDGLDGRALRAARRCDRRRLGAAHGTRGCPGPSSEPRARRRAQGCSRAPSRGAHASERSPQPGVTPRGARQGS